MNEIDARVRKLEEWRIQIDRDLAVHFTQRQHMDERFDRVEKALDDMKAGFWKIAWLVIGSVVVAFVTFVIQGGLNIGS